MENKYYREGCSAEDIAKHFNEIGEPQSAARPVWDAKEVYKIVVEQKSFDNRDPFMSDSYSTPDFSEANAPILSPTVIMQDDPLLSKCVKLTLSILESQKQFILARHESMPTDASDAFSVGYIAGTSLFISTMHNAGPDGYYLALEVASRSLFGELGKEVKDRVSAYVDVLEPDFLKGKKAAENEIDLLFRQQAEKRNLIIPPMGWATHAVKGQG